MANESKILRFDVPTVEQIAKELEWADEEMAEKVCEILIRCNNGEIGHEVALKECDKALDTCGVTGLDIEGADSYTDCRIRFCPPFSYCNTGDSYAATLARDHMAGQWVIASWSELAEEYEKENKLGDFEEFEGCPERCPSCHKESFTLKSFKRGEWEDGQWTTTGTGYCWVCAGCNHHCATPEDFEPSATCEVCDEVFTPILPMVMEDPAYCSEECEHIATSEAVGDEADWG